MKNALPPIATTPAARPSRPSTKFTALIVTRTTRMVMMIDIRGEPMITPPKGIESRATPLIAMKPAASACPASFVIQCRSQMSSMTPRMHSSAAAPATPMIGPMSTKIRARNGVWEAKTRPTTTAPNIATPPSLGVGTEWTSRSRRGEKISPRSATLRTMGVSRYATSAETTRMKR
ncbi:Uncharacterised protein [Mycobacteroides abscessus subsp. abscessus]|nr:Uncharacterised protein [Mycobacteroides abscessus subsp. abscessus]